MTKKRVSLYVHMPQDDLDIQNLYRGHASSSMNKILTEPQTLLKSGVSQTERNEQGEKRGCTPWYESSNFTPPVAMIYSSIRSEVLL